MLLPSFGVSVATKSQVCSPVSLRTLDLHGSVARPNSAATVPAVRRSIDTFPLAINNPHTRDVNVKGDFCGASPNAGGAPDPVVRGRIRRNNCRQRELRN